MMKFIIETYQVPRKMVLEIIIAIGETPSISSNFNLPILPPVFNESTVSLLKDFPFFYAVSNLLENLENPLHLLL